jgi:hypothetical protein
MSNEIPKDDVSASGRAAKKASEDRELPGSLGLEISEHIPLDDGVDNSGGHGTGVDIIDPGVMLMPHERKLSASEQRQILNMRRHVDDDTDLDEREMREGRKPRRWHGMRKDVAPEIEQSNGHHGGKSHRSGNGHQTSDGDAADMPKKTSSSRTALLDDAANTHKPLFEAVQKGVDGLDPSKVPLSPTDRTNIAGALTANMLQTPGFHGAKPDPETLSISASDRGDRIFAVNSQNPASPSAVYTSVVVDEARRQPLEVSSALVAAQPPSSPTPAAAVQEQEQTQQIGSQAPRSVA